MRHGVVAVVACVLGVACGDDGELVSDTSSTGSGGTEADATDAGSDGSASASTGASASGTDGTDTGAPEPWTWDLPPGFPEPYVPPDNPMTPEKVDLGRYLFWDVRLSANETQSCGSCHAQELAFSDGLVTSVGSTGEVLVRNSMSLTNAAYSFPLTWAAPALVDLEHQVLVPIFGETPIELGATGHEDEILERFRSDATYPELFEAAFPDRGDPFTFASIRDAIACFVRTMISGNAPFDRYTYGDEGAISASARRGSELFFSERLECHHCHGSFNFSHAVKHADTAFESSAFHNTGLYDIDGMGAYPLGNQGLIDATGEPDDMGKFRVPTLRNVAVTAPYMHDGSVATLEEVVAIYEAGGRVIESGPDAGDGRSNPFKSGFITGFMLTEQERADLLAFLESLTDEDFLTDPSFSDPFE